MREDYDAGRGGWGGAAAISYEEDRYEPSGKRARGGNHNEEY